MSALKKRATVPSGVGTTERTANPRVGDKPAKWMLRRQAGSPILPCEMSGTGVSRRREMALAQ
jgi:hypothetical protein